MKTTKLIPLAALCCTPPLLVAGGDVKSSAEAMFEKADTNVSRLDEVVRECDCSP